jgi:hypothetical protein
MRKNFQNLGTLRAGTVYRNNGKIQCASENNDWPTSFEVEVIGHGARVRIPGLEADMSAFVHGKHLYVGCQRIPIQAAFKALAKLAGYEVTP